MLDIQQQKSQELALIEAKKQAEAATIAKSAFLAAMSHEIRTPLNGVLGMAQSLVNDGLLTDQREKVDVILESGKTLTALLNDILSQDRSRQDKSRPGFDLHHAGAPAARSNPGGRRTFSYRSCEGSGPAGNDRCAFTAAT
jgi:signal transduction histidine kinase